MFTNYKDVVGESQGEFLKKGLLHDVTYDTLLALKRDF
jgi:hypothetical protein